MCNIISNSHTETERREKRGTESGQLSRKARTTGSAQGGYTGVVPRVESTLLHAFHVHREIKCQGRPPKLRTARREK